MKEEDKIFVTQPAMPPLDEFINSLTEIWDNKILTNNGPFHIKFEKALAEYLGVNNISLFSIHQLIFSNYYAYHQSSSQKHTF